MNSEKKINLSQNFKDQISPQSQFLKKKLPGIKKIIAISSAKGGVGKSTISANLSVALSQLNQSVGLLDADIYGPSIPDLFNINEKPTSDENGKIEPIQKQNIKLMSMGFLIEKDSPMVWRGPMVIKAIKMFLDNVNWGNLDYLIVDLPPGTGDAILTFAQELNVDGSIIVTTPQQLSITDANRGIEMFKKTNIPILGIIENMSFIEDKDGNKMFPFGKDGSDNLSKKQGVRLLEKIKIDSCFNKSVEKGIVFEELSDDIKEKFLKIGREILN